MNKNLPLIHRIAVTLNYYVVGAFFVGIFTVLYSSSGRELGRFELIDFVRVICFTMMGLAYPAINIIALHKCVRPAESKIDPPNV